MKYADYPNNPWCYSAFGCMCGGADCGNIPRGALTCYRDSPCAGCDRREICDIVQADIETQEQLELEDSIDNHITKTADD